MQSVASSSDGAVPVECLTPPNRIGATLRQDAATISAECVKLAEWDAKQLPEEQQAKLLAKFTKVFTHYHDLYKEYNKTNTLRRIARPETR